MFDVYHGIRDARTHCEFKFVHISLNMIVEILQAELFMHISAIAKAAIQNCPYEKVFGTYAANFNAKKLY